MNTPPISQHITLSRVAEMANTTPQNVSNWRRRSTGFPQPVAGTERRPLFDRTEMVQWLKANSHYNDNPGFATRLWAFMDGLRVSVSPVESLQIALAAVVWHSLSKDASSVPGEFSLIGEPSQVPAAVKAPTHMVSEAEIEESLTRLSEWARATLKHPYAGVFDPLVEALPRVGASFLSIVLPEILTTPENSTELENALDDVLDRSNSQDVLGRTRPLMRDLACAILDIQPGDTILDAACGSGSFLLHAGISQDGVRCVGVDISTDQLRIAASTALISGVPLDLRLGSSMTEDPAEDVRAERVFIDPPFNLKIQDQSDLQGDPRWIFGLPTVNLDFAWVQHAIARLSRHGRAVVVLPSGDLSSGSGRKIRIELLKQGALEAVIALPRGTYPGMNIAPTLWVLQQPNTTSRDAGVLLIDASDHDVFTTSSLEWVTETIVEYRLKIDLQVGRPRAAVISVIDLLAEDANIAPSRWLAEASTVDHQTLDAGGKAVEHALQQLKTETWHMPWSVSETKVPFLKVGDLLRTQSLGVIKSRRALTSSMLKDSGRIPVLTPAALMGDQSKQNYIEALPSGGGIDLTEAGDVALWAAHNRIHTKVLDTGGAVPGPQIQILRVMQSSFTPDYLAACLAGVHNERFLVGGVITRLDIQNLEIPAAPLEEQRNISQQLRKLDELRKEASRLVAELNKLQALVQNGVGEGTLRVGRDSSD